MSGAGAEPPALSRLIDDAVQQRLEAARAKLREVRDSSYIDSLRGMTGVEAAVPIPAPSAA